MPAIESDPLAFLHSHTGKHSETTKKKRCLLLITEINVTESALLPLRRQLVKEGSVVHGPDGVLGQAPVLVLGQLVQHLPLRLGSQPAVQAQESSLAGI